MAASSHATSASSASYWRARGGKRSRRASLTKRVSNLETRLSATTEVKNHSYPWTTAVSTAPLIYDTTAIASATSETDRVGVTINPLSIRLRVRLDSEGASDANAWRLILFVWNDDSFPGGGDIITPPSGSWAVLPNAIDRPINYTNGGKFRVLYDHNVTVDDSMETRVFDRTVALPKSMRTRFKDSTATSGIHGRLFICIMSDSVAVPHPIFGGYSTLRYMDS